MKKTARGEVGRLKETERVSYMAEVYEIGIKSRKKPAQPHIAERLGRIAHGGQTAHPLSRSMHDVLYATAEGRRLG